MYDQIPEPILLNGWKHHLGYISGKIKKYEHKDQLNVLKQDLLKIGRSTTDLYTGTLSAKTAAEIAMNALMEKDLVDPARFRKWIHESPEAYQSMEYPDNSIWIFRSGNHPGRYVHIHPGRGVPHTIRAKASVLKITISAIVYSRVMGVDPLDMDCINTVRKEILEVSPVKNIADHTELGKMISLLQSGL